MGAQRKTIEVGTRIGKLVVIGIGKPYLRTNNKGTHSTSICKCDCGTIKTFQNRHLLSGTKSCGCYRRERLCKHGEVRNGKVSRLYHIWSSMRNRCNNERVKGYHNYGGRGIKVCNEWNNYLNFKNWAMSNGYTNSLSIDRIDTNGNYSPMNCRWANRETQNNNKRTNVRITINGENHTMAQWCRKLHMSKFRIKKHFLNQQLPMKGN